MFSTELSILIPTTITIAFLHTILGPDHYVPFVAMAKARNWSMVKTIWTTFFAGLGHILGSITLGIIGLIFGLAIKKLEIIESFQGNLAGWMLVIFGAVYFAWGIKKAIRNKPHTHKHIHEDGIAHSHKHSHEKTHLHIHDSQNKKDITPWILFAIFIFGPCEALIPIFMFTAINNTIYNLIFVTIVFGIVTIITMLGIVVSSIYGISFIKINRFEKYSHAITGIIISSLGIGILFLGL